MSNYFFSPPAHLCAVTYMTEISLIVTLNYQFTIYHGWLVVLMIYVVSAVFQPYHDLEAGDNQSLKSGEAGNRTKTFHKQNVLFSAQDISCLLSTDFNNLYLTPTKN